MIEELNCDRNRLVRIVRQRTRRKRRLTSLLMMWLSTIVTTIWMQMIASLASRLTLSLINLDFSKNLHLFVRACRFRNASSMSSLSSINSIRHVSKTCCHLTFSLLMKVFRRRSSRTSSTKREIISRLSIDLTSTRVFIVSIDIWLLRIFVSIISSNISSRMSSIDSRRCRSLFEMKSFESNFVNDFFNVETILIDENKSSRSSMRYHNRDLWATSMTSTQSSLVFSRMFTISSISSSRNDVISKLSSLALAIIWNKFYLSRKILSSTRWWDWRSNSRISMSSSIIASNQHDEVLITRALSSRTILYKENFKSCKSRTSNVIIVINSITKFRNVKMHTFQIMHRLIESLVRSLRKKIRIVRTRTINKFERIALKRREYWDTRIECCDWEWSNLARKRSDMSIKRKNVWVLTFYCQIERFVRIDESTAKSINVLNCLE